MGGFQPWHWIVVAIVAAVLFFGWKQLPDMARSVGRSLRVFKTEIKGMGDDDKSRDDHARGDHDGDNGGARDNDGADAAPRQLPARPTPVHQQKQTPRAEVVRNASAATPAAPRAAAARPRPAPSPNGRSRG